MTNKTSPTFVEILSPHLNSETFNPLAVFWQEKEPGFIEFFFGEDYTAQMYIFLHRYVGIIS